MSKEGEHLRVGRADLLAAVEAGALTQEQGDHLWSFLAGRAQADDRATDRTNDRGAGLTLQRVLYYAGALIVIGAMGWYVTDAWDALSGYGFMAISLAYAGFFVLAGLAVLRRGGYSTPGGLLITLAVCMTPMFLYGLELALGIWPSGSSLGYSQFYARIRPHWILMEMGTLACVLVALRFVRFPFLTAPAAVALWFFSMDLAPFLLGATEISRDERAWVSCVVGLAMLAASVRLDAPRRSDFAFWGYLFGLAAFWGGLTSMDSTSELGKFLYCLVNAGLMLVSVLLQRRAFLVFGALGVTLYIGELAYRLFRDSLLFPFALSALGLGVMALGVLYQRHGAAVDAAVLRVLPPWLRRNMLPRSAESAQG